MNKRCSTKFVHILYSIIDKNVSLCRTVSQPFVGIFRILYGLRRSRKDKQLCYRITQYLYRERIKTRLLSSSFFFVIIFFCNSFYSIRFSDWSFFLTFHVFAVARKRDRGWENKMRACACFFFFYKLNYPNLICFGYLLLKTLREDCSRRPLNRLGFRKMRFRFDKFTFSRLEVGTVKEIVHFLKLKFNFHAFIR